MLALNCTSIILGLHQVTFVSKRHTTEMLGEFISSPTTKEIAEYESCMCLFWMYCQCEMRKLFRMLLLVKILWLACNY